MLPKDYTEFLQSAMGDLYSTANKLAKAKHIKFGEAVEFIKTTALICLSASIANLDVNFAELINSSQEKGESNGS